MIRWADWELALVREFDGDTYLLRYLLPLKPAHEIVSMSLIIDQVNEECDLDREDWHLPLSPEPQVMGYFDWQKVKREQERRQEQDRKRKEELATAPRYEVLYGKYTCAFCYGSPGGCPECDRGFLYDPIRDRRTGHLRIWSKV